MAADVIIRDSTNTPRTITEIVVRDATNTPRTITEIWVRDANNVPRLVFDPTGVGVFEVDASPTSVVGFASSGTTATTNNTTATPTGGASPFTYAWTTVSFSSGSPPSIGSPTAATTNFTQTALSPEDLQAATFRVTVTDGNGNTATADVPATFVGPSIGGGGIIP